ncbi:MAG: Gfo/Idh/MocA family protein [Thermodesulfobacteriota bacterium]
MKKIRVGVIGVGYFGQFHVEKYAKMRGVELVGVVDIHATRAREIANRFHTQPFLHHSELFGKVQAVSITVPTPFHHSITKDFFLHGVDVLLEKPIANTLEEADELVDLARSKGLILQIGHLERFNGAFLAVERMARNPRLIEAHRLGPFSGRGGEVNVVLDLMIHDIDIVLSLVNSRVKEIHAMGLPVLTRSFDVAQAWIEFENGCTANLIASRVSTEKVRKARIYQPNQILSIDFLFQKASLSKKALPRRKRPYPDMVTREIPVKKNDPLEVEIASFLRSVRNRKEARVSGWDGRVALEVALWILQRMEEADGRGWASRSTDEIEEGLTGSRRSFRRSFGFPSGGGNPGD